MNGFASVVRIFHSRGAEEKGSNGLRERIKHSKPESWSTSVMAMLRQPFADIASWVRLGTAQNCSVRRVAIAKLFRLVCDE